MNFLNVGNSLYINQKLLTQNIDEKYEIKNIIGSGSIGQTYLLEDIKTKEKNVMKILHPNVKNQIDFFERFVCIQFCLIFCLLSSRQKIA